MRPAILFLLLIICSFAFCQKAYKKGYIVKSSSDTIHGFIEEDLEEKLSISINFKEESGASEILSTSDIKAFGFDQGPIFRLVNYVDPLDSLKIESHFAKLLMDGFYDVFSFRRKDNLFFVAVNKDTAYLLYDDEKTQLGEVIEQGNYRNFLAFLGRDCPQMAATTSEVNYTEQGITSYFIALEKCKGNFKSTMIKYSRPKMAKYILVTAGAFGVDKRSEVIVQALLQLTLPSVNKKTSISMGIVYLRNTTKSNSPYSFGEIKGKHVSEFYEIPALFRYDLFSKVIEPYLYAGPGVLIRREQETTTKTSLGAAETVQSNDRSFDPTILVGVGISILMSKKFYINADWRYDWYSHLPIVGVGFRSNKF
ncbi:MAG TPA: hypothetical protein VFP87_02085 [Chitinophagaceae bacterium]|nr:hypothetical protein [Chitinophagaceae bacterium]